MDRIGSLIMLIVLASLFVVSLVAVVAIGIVAVWTVDPELQNKLGGTCGVLAGLALVAGFGTAITATVRA